MKDSEAPKKKWLTGKIETREDARKIARDAGIAFFVVAALNLAFYLIFQMSSLIDIVLFALGGFLVWRFQNRTFATILLVSAAAGVVITFANRMFEAGIGAGGKNVMLSIVVLYVGIRAVEATYKFHGKFSEKNSSEDS